MRILVADGDLTHRTDLVKFFTELGHTVEEVLSVSEITKKCRSKCPELILIDSNLAGTKGTDVIRQIRQTQEHNNIPTLEKTRDYPIQTAQ